GGLIMESIKEAENKTCQVQKSLEFFSHFLQDKMCGKCLPCMYGTEQIIEILQKLIQGEGEENDTHLLRLISSGLEETVRCKHGRDAAAVLTSSLLFEEQYQEHWEEKRCSSRSCEKLTSYRVIAEKCTMCGLCKEICPEGAVFGEEYIPYLADNEPYYIEANKCSKCGRCLEVCPEGAIEVV
ncbi:NADP-reducing hydrogenase subunit HndC, partial [Candidatus Hakubella thermalkaliphila]